MNKRFFIISMMVCMISFQPLYSQSERQTELLDKIHGLQEQLTYQQNEIEDLKSKKVKGMKFGKGISGLTLKGDARFRYEARERERQGKEDDSRDRYRIRLRIGGVWHNDDDNWEIGVGLATGETGTGSATSTNQSFSKSGVFQTNDINLDFAYVKHSWENVELTIGQHKNPWKATTTYIVWGRRRPPSGNHRKV